MNDTDAQTLRADDVGDHGKPAGGRPQEDATEGEGGRGQVSGRDGGNGKPPYKRPGVWVVAAIALIATGVGGVFYLIHAARYESTDDAFIDAHVTNLAPQVAGRVVGVNVTDNQMVHRGDVLLQIDPASYEIALRQAKAQHAAAEAKLTQAEAALPAAKARVDQARADVQAARARADLGKTNLHRTQNLAQRGAVSQQALDGAQARAKASTAALAAARQQLAGAQADATQAQSNLQAARAGVQQSEVGIDSAQLNLDRTTVKAPIDGHVTNKAVEPGDYVQPGEQLMAIVEPHVWVTADFKETELTKMRPGQPVTIEIDTYPGKRWKGRVDSFQHGTGARFSLLPPENATGNYVKVVQRIPVKIVFDHLPDPNKYLLAPGMSVEPEVNVSVRPHALTNRRTTPSAPPSVPHHR